MAASISDYSLGAREYNKFVLDGDDNVAIRTTATFEGTIGEVAITDTIVDAANTARNATDKVLVTQVLDAAGAPIQTSAIATATSRLTSSANSMAPNTTLATTSFAVGGQYNATPPTFTDTESGAMQLDANGKVLTKSTPVAKTGVVKTSDGQVKGSAGVVYAVQVSGVGVTAGDKVEIKNSTDNSGAALITMVADAANGTWSFYPCVGITYDTGIYSDETKSGGTFTVTVVYE